MASSRAGSSMDEAPSSATLSREAAAACASADAGVGTEEAASYKETQEKELSKKIGSRAANASAARFKKGRRRRRMKAAPFYRPPPFPPEGRRIHRWARAAALTCQ